jgi:poly(3-hydroxybutyrate) depolymerase
MSPLIRGSRRADENPPMPRRPLLPALALLGPAIAAAASTVPLPPSLCSADIVFASGFETAPAIPTNPSGGSGGPYPGDQSRVVNVPGLGSHIVYLYVPTTYSPAHAMPLLLAMHGTAGNAGSAPAAARQVRDDWSSVAESGGFIVIAPVASGTNGSWEPPIDVPVIFATIADTAARYDVEQTRLDMWGYSAGGHLAHALALENTDFFAAYGVSAGALTQYACTDSGAPPPSCTALLGAAQPKIPVDVHIGVQDPLYLYYGANGDNGRFQAGGWVPEQTLFWRPFAGGHTYTVAQLGEIWANVCPFALAP